MNKNKFLAVIIIALMAFRLCGCKDISISLKKSNSIHSDTNSFNNGNEFAEKTEQEYRNVLSNKCPDKEITNAYFGDFDKDGKFEMFAFVAEKGSENLTADLYYVNYEGANCIQSGKSYYTQCNSFYKLSNVTMFKTEEGYGGSGSVSHAWIVKDSSKVFNVDNTGEQLAKADDDDFFIHPSEYDIGLDGGGHTRKPYYLHWNGEAFEEYGGIKISEEDLCKAKGGKAIIDKIKNDENIIGDIFYRKNGIVNINYHNDSENMYATLSYNNGSVIDITDDEFYGIYSAAYYPEIAFYPDSWQLS